MTDDTKAPLLYGPDGRPIPRPPTIDVPATGRTPVPAPTDDRPGTPHTPEPRAMPASVNLEFLEPPTESNTFQLPPIDSNLLLIAGGFSANRVGIPVTVTDNDLTERRLNVRYAGTAPINLEVLEYDTDLLWGRVAWTVKGRTEKTLKLRLKGIVAPEHVPPPTEAS